MRILVAHNRYQWSGGEDRVVSQERALLEEHGHHIVSLEEDNKRISDINPLALAGMSMWNTESYAKVLRLIDHERIDLMHVHNYFPLLSPSIFAAAKSKRIGVVHTLHNFRLACINGLFFRDGKPCEDCLSANNFFPGIVHRCYRSNIAASVVAAMSVGSHNIMRTIHDSVDRFIAINEHARTLFIQSGLPADKIRIKENFLKQDEGVGTGDGDYAIYLGRLSSEKGIEVLLAAWNNLENKIPLKIAGDGPLANLVKEAAKKNPLIEYLGWLEEPQLLSVLGKAKLSILPSICYESAAPLVLIQSMAKGIPVVASRLGAMECAVREGETGLLFKSGDSADLARQVSVLYSDEIALTALRREARKEFELKYSAKHNYERLLRIYNEALGARISGD